MAKYFEKTAQYIKNKKISTNTSGIIYGNVSNASTLYGEDKFFIPNIGHGYAAKKANHLYDRLSKKNTKFVGDDNKKWSVDRNVDSINIQSKYYKTGKCIS